MLATNLKKEQIHVILAVTFGNILEWFEIYSYAYLAPVLSKVFFNFHSPLTNLIFFFLIFGVGFITRPIGALLFGHKGDHKGRKNAFMWSIGMLTIPTFLIGCLPTYQQVGILAPILLLIGRLAQSIPEAGESAGTFCFLYENGDFKNKRFITSWGGVGNQLGAILGVVEFYFTDQIMSQEFTMTWGWRISFWTGGLIGLTGLFLRSTLHETPTFKKLEEHHRIDTETTRELLKNHKKNIVLGTCFGVINASTFYFIATYIPTYFDSRIGLSYNQNIFVTLSILFLTTVTLPLFGKMGDLIKNRPIFIICSVIIIVLLFPLYVGVKHDNLILLSVIGSLYLIPITCITALIPFQLAHLFEPPVRFTGVGLTFNLADGIIGGFTPSIVLIIVKFSHSPTAFCWFILACAIVSLISYFYIKD